MKPAKRTLQQKVEAAIRRMAWYGFSDHKLLTLPQAIGAIRRVFSRRSKRRGK